MRRILFFLFFFLFACTGNITPTQAFEAPPYDEEEYAQLLENLFPPLPARPLYFGEIANSYGNQKRPVFIHAYGLDNGTWEFSDGITIQAQEKVTEIFDNPEESYINYGPGVFQPLDESLSIPQTNEFIDDLIKNSGGYQSFLTLLKKGKTMTNPRSKQQYVIPTIRLIGSEYRCMPPYDFFWGASIPGMGVEYQDCMFENGQELVTNTRTYREFMTVSENDHEATLRIFPIDPKKFRFPFDDTNAVPIMIIDPAMEYYNIVTSEYANMNTSKQKRIPLTKHYKAYPYTLGDDQTTIVVYPYYELRFPVKKGTRRVSITYYSYTPKIQGRYIITE